MTIDEIIENRYVLGSSEMVKELRICITEENGNIHPVLIISVLKAIEEEMYYEALDAKEEQ